MSGSGLRVSVIWIHYLYLKLWVLSINYALLYCEMFTAFIDHARAAVCFGWSIFLLEPLSALPLVFCFIVYFSLHVSINALFRCVFLCVFGSSRPYFIITTYFLFVVYFHWICSYRPHVGLVWLDNIAVGPFFVFWRCDSSTFVWGFSQNVSSLLWDPIYGNNAYGVLVFCNSGR